MDRRGVGRREQECRQQQGKGKRKNSAQHRATSLLLGLRKRPEIFGLVQILLQTARCSRPRLAFPPPQQQRAPLLRLIAVLRGDGSFELQLN
jgi:hypothetical protein